MGEREGWDLGIFEPLGLDRNLISIYRTLLRNPDWGIPEVCAHLAIGEEQVRESLDRLVEFSLLRISAWRSGHVRPMDPEIALKALLARSEEYHLRRQRMIEEARTAIAAIADEYRMVQSTDSYALEHLDGLDMVRTRLEELALTARHECLSFLPGGAQSPDAMEASRDLDRRSMARGVRLCTVYQESARNDRATVEYATWLAKAGGFTRIAPVLPLHLLIVDREVALVPLQPDEIRRGAIQIRGAGVVTALVALFEQVWESAAPFGEPRQAGVDGLLPDDRALLRLLADGCTDEATARQLGLSLRTVRRKTSDLFSRLGARSRFQAGVRAARNLWV